MSSHSKQNDKPVIGITLGDINGIGPEVVIKTLSDNRILQLFTPVIFGSTKVLAFYRKAMEEQHFNYAQVKNNSRELIYKKVNVVNCWDEMMPISVGEVTPEGGQAAFLALKEAANYLKEGAIDALVTAPINKKNIQQKDFEFPGHTEFFASTFGVRDSLMFMVSETMKIGVATGHMPLQKVSRSLTRGVLESKLSIMLHSLKNDFGLHKPRVAILGLNPHAGEDGLLGKEEDEVIRPVMKKLKEDGHLLFGPFPADGFFGKGEHTRYDAIMAMYHDQGLIPFKTLTFQQGTNFTAGLPVIRTSPDHGTAYSLAGKNEANENSMRAAVFTALDIIKNRKENV